MEDQRFIKIETSKRPNQKNERIYSFDISIPNVLSDFYSKLYTLLGNPNETLYEEEVEE